MAKKTRGFYPANTLRVVENGTNIGQLILFDWSSYLSAADWLNEHAPCLGTNARISRPGAEGWHSFNGTTFPQYGDRAGGRVHCVTKMADGTYHRGFTFFGVLYDEADGLTVDDLLEHARRAGVRYFVGIPGMQVPSPAMAGLVRMFLDAGVDSVELSTLQRAVSTRL